MTAAHPTLTVRALRPVVAGLEALGVEIAPVLHEVGVSRNVLEQPEERVSHMTMMRLWRLAERSAGDADLGLHVAESAPLESFEIHGYAITGSATLGEAFARACRYQRLIHATTRLVLDVGDAEAALAHGLADGSPVPRQPGEFLVATWIRFGRMVAGTGWSPTRVDLAHPRPRSIAEHERVFGCPVRFSAARNAIHFPSQDLDLPNRRADPSLVALLDRYATSLLAREPADDSTAERLRAWLLDRLAGGVPSAEEAARAMARSVRSLHRDLRSEGTTWRAVLDRLRHERAVELLDDGRASLAEIAFLLGFSEVRSFHRAFRRWTGATPGAFRNG